MESKDHYSLGTCFLFERERDVLVDDTGPESCGSCSDRYARQSQQITSSSFELSQSGSPHRKNPLQSVQLWP